MADVDTKAFEVGVNTACAWANSQEPRLNHYTELKALGSGVFGVTAQDSECQREARDRLQLPFQLLSDSSLQLNSALRLPTFRVNGLELYKRLTLIIETGKIEKVFYPVFPPDKNAEEVLTWLKLHAPTRRTREIDR